MTAPSSIDPAHFLHEQLAQASPDLLRQLLTTFINTLMSAEADAVCGAEYGTRSSERTNEVFSPGFALRGHLGDASLQVRPLRRRGAECRRA